MNQSRLLSESCGSMLWAPEVPCLIVRFHGCVTLEQYQVLMNRGLEMYTHHTQDGTTAGWIADTRQLSDLPAEAQRWLATDWAPRAYSAGLRHLSFVETEYTLSQLAQEYFTTATPVDSFSDFQLTQHDTMQAAIQRVLQSSAAPSMRVAS